jgi:hypothetical protein
MVVQPIATTPSKGKEKVSNDNSKNHLYQCNRLLKLLFVQQTGC